MQGKTKEGKYNDIFLVIDYRLHKDKDMTFKELSNPHRSILNLGMQAGVIYQNTWLPSIGGNVFVRIAF